MMSCKDGGGGRRGKVFVTTGQKAMTEGWGVNIFKICVTSLINVPTDGRGAKK